MKSASTTASLPTLLIRLWRHFGRRRQGQFILLAGLVLVGALAEIVSLGAVLPFLGVLVAPELILHRPLGVVLARAFGVTSGRELIFPLTVAFAVAAAAAGGVRLLLLWVSTRWSFALGVDLSIDMYRRSLFQPYKVHVARNSSDVISAIASKTSTVVTAILLPSMLCISSVCALVATAATLIVIDPLIAVLSGFGFGAPYVIIMWLSRRRLQRNARIIASDQTQLFKALQEGLGGIRDILLDGSQPFYCNVYHQADKSLRTAQASNTFIASSPRFAMEALGMMLMAGISYSMVRRPGGIAVALPILGTFAFGAQRLIPTLQQAFSSWSTVLGNDATLSDTLELLDQPLPYEAMSTDIELLPFQQFVRFDGVRFRYSDDGPWVLRGLNLTITKGSRVGFVGATGSGKSTLLDLLMGLLEPTEGQILVDNEPIVGSLVRPWQRNIAHVPQSVYLADASLAENIAFGVSRTMIDMERVKEVSRRAQIADFIESGPNGYQAPVGERGVRLSGGQRQRVGIARALYKQATVLVFDEATSALDNLTEQAVMDAIESLDRDLTILIIAHRLSTVKRCDRIVELDRGRVVAEGSYSELLRDSRSFCALAASAGS